MAALTYTLLGHRVSRSRIEPTPHHREAIAAMEPPRNGQQLLRLLGTVNWFAQHIPDFARVARPLYDLLEGCRFKRKPKRQPIRIENFDARWGPAQENAFLT